MDQHLLDLPPSQPGTVAFLGWGNVARGDDALGLEFIDAIDRMRSGHPGWPPLKLLRAQQLSLEHVLDLRGCEVLVLVDAGANGSKWSLRPLLAGVSRHSLSHSVSPHTLLSTFEKVFGCLAPMTFVLKIRGYSFDFGAPLSEDALRNLGDALAAVEALLDHPAEGWLLSTAS